MKTNKKTKKTDYRHFICVLITLGFVACSVFVFPNALGRVVESCRDIYTSFAYFVCNILKIETDIVPTVNSLPKFPFFDFWEKVTTAHPAPPTTSMPETSEEFVSKWDLYWSTFVDSHNLFLYLFRLGNILFNICNVLLIVFPFFILFRILIIRHFSNVNNDYNEDSYQLRLYKKLLNCVIVPTVVWFRNFILFCRDNSIYLKLWFCIWLFNFNILTIVLEFFAFYIYFSVSFDFVSIYIQVYKLFLDLSVPLKFIPIWVWLIVGLFVFDYFRKKLGYRRLRHMEYSNRHFLNSTSIVLFICGTMGKNKTTSLTDMALSQEIIMRNNAYKKILENDLKFPNFPWINLENEIKEAMSKPIGAVGRIYSLSSCSRFIEYKLELWLKNKYRKKFIFDYDYERYGITYNDDLKVVGIWEVLEIYTKLYFIYTIQSSLIISNYSIRSDNLIQDLGNFPLWHTDFFQRDPRLMQAHSRHVHILDYDMLRLGRKLVEDNPNRYAFEFGVVCITEIGKERLNNLEMNGVKKMSDETNQKNDLFNYMLKMIRHPAVVDNCVFTKVITDEQRPESWGADSRDLSEIIFIKECSSLVLAMPFFTLGELLYSWIYGRFERLYREYRHNRGDNTLLMYLIKSISTWYYRYYVRIYNRFSYKVLSLDIENALESGRYNQSTYYLMSKKIYSQRFATDCFGNFFKKRSSRSFVGIADIPSYSGIKATSSDLEKQNSYFIRDMEKFD